MPVSDGSDGGVGKQGAGEVVGVDANRFFLESTDQ